VSLSRLVLVTRRYWPLIGGAEVVMSNLAAGLASRGLKVTLLTARWQRDWPRQVEHRGFRVVRLSQPSVRGLGTWCYMQALDRWLRQHESVDLAYVSMLKHSAYATIGAGKRDGFPVAIRAEGAGATGDVHWQLDARFGKRIRKRCAQAAALVAPSEAVERELIAAGYPRDRILHIPNGVAIPDERTPERRRQARESLTDTRPDLTISADVPLVVYTGRLDLAKGLKRLVSAWPLVLQRHGNAQLWLVGEGPAADELTRQISADDLDEHVRRTGPVDDVSRILTAADMFVLPSKNEGLPLSLLEAMAVGLPTVATDIPGNRQLLGNNQFGRLVPNDDDRRTLADTIVALLDDSSLAAKLADVARTQVKQHYSLDAMVDAHLELFERLAREPEGKGSTR